MKIPQKSFLDKLTLQPPSQGQGITGSTQSSAPPNSARFGAVLDKFVENHLQNPLSQGTALDKTQLHEITRLVAAQMRQSLMQALFSTEDGQEETTDATSLPVLPGGAEIPAAASNTKRSEGNSSPAAASGDYDTLINEAGRTYGVDARLIRSVIRAESGFDAKATSPKGAMGLMQLMPGTARDLGVSDPYSPRENIMAGTRYLKNLLDRYEGNVNLALGAYNWGMGNIERHPERLPDETRQYIARVNRYYQEA